MYNAIYYEQLLDNYHTKIRDPNIFLSDKENRQFKLLHQWWLKDNFTKEQLESFKAKYEKIED